MDLPPLNVNKFQASVDIIRYCEWPKIKKYMNRKFVKAVNECKTQATIAKKFVVQIDKKKWKIIKQSSSKCDLEEKYDFDEDEAISWGSDFDDDEEEEEEEEDDEKVENVTNVAAKYTEDNYFSDERKNSVLNHYNLKQLNEHFAGAEQIMNVGCFERIGTPTISLNNSVTHYSNPVPNGSVCSLNVSTSMSSEASSCDSSNGCSSNSSSISSSSSNSSTTSSTSNRNKSSSNSSRATGAICSLSKSPSTSNTSETKLACKLLTKLLTNTNNDPNKTIEICEKKNDEQLKKLFNEQLKQALNLKLNRIKQEKANFCKSNIDFINHNNNYLKSVDYQLYDSKSYFHNRTHASCSNIASDSNVSNTEQDYDCISNEPSNLNSDLSTSTSTIQAGHLRSTSQQKIKKTEADKSKNITCKTTVDQAAVVTVAIAASSAELETTKSRTIISNRMNPPNYNNQSNVSSNKTSTEFNNFMPSSTCQTNENSSACEDGLSSECSSVLSSLKFHGSDFSGSSSSSLKSVSLKQTKPAVPPKPVITNKLGKCGKKKANCKIVNRPMNEPPPPPIPKSPPPKSPYGSTNSFNQDLISEFTVEEVNEILNCKLSEDEEVSNSELCQAKSLQHLNELEKNQQVKVIENGLRINSLQSIQFKTNTKLDLNQFNQNSSCNLEFSKTELKKQTKSDTYLNKHCESKPNQVDKLSASAYFNSKNTIVEEDELTDNYEQPICNNLNATNENQSKISLMQEDKTKDKYYLISNNESELNENAISPPPEFDDKQDVKRISKIVDNLNTLNVKYASDLSKKDINLVENKISKYLKTGFNVRLNSGNSNLPSALPPPPASFSSKSSLNNSSFLSSSLLVLPSELNRTKLPKNNKTDLNLSSNRLNVKKLPNKLKSLPELLSSKINLVERINHPNKDLNNLNKPQSNCNLTKNHQSNQLALRPLPPLPLEHYPWYHDIEREEAGNLLIKFAKEGAFLVRKSKRAGSCNPYSLTIYHNEKIFNLNIRKRLDGLFALGKEKEKEKTFQTIPQLIEYHQKEAILLTTKGQNAGMTKLIITPPK